MTHTINARVVAMGVALALAVVPALAGTVTAGEDDVTVQCHAPKAHVYTWASKYRLAPGEQFTQYVRTYVSYQTVPHYITGYMRSMSGVWDGPTFNWGPIWNQCYYVTNAYTVTAPEEPGPFQMWAFGKSYGWPSPTNYRWSSLQYLEVVAPRLDVTRDAPTTAIVGEQVAVTLNLRNVGNDAAIDVTLTENLPAGLRVDDSGGAAVADGTLQWTIPRLDAGATATVTYLATPTTRGPATLTAAATGTAPTGYPVSTVGTPHVLTVLGPALEFEHDMPETVASGELVTVRVTVRNVGEVAATDLVIGDTFSSDYTLVPADVRVANAGEPTTVTPRMPRVEFAYGSPIARETADPLRIKGDESTTLTWAVGDLAPGEEFVVAYALVAPVRHALVDAQVPDEPPAPGVPPEPPATVNENAGTYGFVADGTFATAGGYALAASSPTAPQAVRAAQQVEPPTVEPPTLPA